MRIKFTTNTELDHALKSGVPDKDANVKIIAFVDKVEYVTMFYPWPKSTEYPHVLMIEERINIQAMKQLVLFIKRIEDKDLVIIGCRDGITISKAIGDWLVDLVPISYDLQQYFEYTAKLPEFPVADEILKLKLYQFSSSQISLADIAHSLIESKNASQELKNTAEGYLNELLHSFSE